MRKLLLLTLIGLAATAVACDQGPNVTDLELTPSFAVWDYKVTGGGEWFVKDGGGERTIIATVSATDFGDEVKGQIEMENVTAGWKIHGVVSCSWFSSDGSEAFLGFEITQNQNDPESGTFVGEPWGIYFQADGGPNGEDLAYWSRRVDKPADETVEYACANGPAGWPYLNGFPYGNFNAILVDGNLNIRG